MKLEQSTGFKIITEWLATDDRHPFLFQKQTWQQIIDQQSGLVNAPTGYGKTYSVFLGAVIQFINSYPKDFQSKKNNGVTQSN